MGRPELTNACELMIRPLGRGHTLNVRSRVGIFVVV